MDMKNFDWEKYLTECLQMTEYCSIGTVDNNGTWSNPIYFAWDDKLNLYFISQPGSRHMQNLDRDSRISAAIYSTAQDTFGDIVGIQLHGKARFLINRDEVISAKAIYHGRRYGSRDKPIPEASDGQYIDNPEWQFVKIEPEEIFYFDTRFFQEERVAVPRELFKR